MQSDIDRVGKDKPKKEMARCWINYAMDQIYGEFILEGKSGHENVRGDCCVEWRVLQPII